MTQRMQYLDHRVTGFRSIIRSLQTRGDKPGDIRSEIESYHLSICLHIKSNICNDKFRMNLLFSLLIDAAINRSPLVCK
jgi:hypothetical protein